MKNPAPQLLSGYSRDYCRKYFRHTAGIIAVYDRMWRHRRLFHPRGDAVSLLRLRPRTHLSHRRRFPRQRRRGIDSDRYDRRRGRYHDIRGCRISRRHGRVLPSRKRQRGHAGPAAASCRHVRVRLRHLFPPIQARVHESRDDNTRCRSSREATCSSARRYMSLRGG